LLAELPTLLEAGLFIGSLFFSIGLIALLFKPFY
jgi:hypothetical protein